MDSTGDRLGPPAECGEQQHLHPVRQCPDVNGVGARCARIFAADNVVQRHSIRRGLFNFVSRDVFELGLLPFEHQTLRVRLVHLSPKCCSHTLLLVCALHLCQAFSTSCQLEPECGEGDEQMKGEMGIALE